MEHGKDRQAVDSFSKVHPGHLERYKFAMARANGFILDAACGTGYGSFMLNQVGECTGVDIEPEAIVYAIENYPGPDYRIGDVCDVHGEFDWVVSFETIEHVQDPGAALDAFRSSNNLIISSPNELEFPFVAEQHKESKYPHLRHYTPEQFEKLLNEHGWTVTEKWGQPHKAGPVFRGGGKFLVWVCK